MTIPHRHKFPKADIPYGGMELICSCGHRIWRYRNGNQVQLLQEVKTRRVPAPVCKMVHQKKRKRVA